MLIRPGCADAALEAAEQLRSRSDLAPLPEHGSADAAAKVATELRARIIKLQRELDSEAARPSAERRSEAMTAFSDELAEAQRADQQLEVGRGARAKATVGSRIHAGVTIRRRLPLATALVAYVVGEQELSVFMLTRAQIIARAFPVGARDLSPRVELPEGLASSLRRQCLDASSGGSKRHLDASGAPPWRHSTSSRQDQTAFSITCRSRFSR